MATVPPIFANMLAIGIALLPSISPVPIVALKTAAGK